MYHGEFHYFDVLGTKRTCFLNITFWLFLIYGFNNFIQMAVRSFFNLRTMHRNGKAFNTEIKTVPYLVMETLITRTKYLWFSNVLKKSWKCLYMFYDIACVIIHIAHFFFKIYDFSEFWKTELEKCLYTKISPFKNIRTMLKFLLWIWTFVKI